MAEVHDAISGDRGTVFAAYAKRMGARGLRLDPVALAARYTWIVDARVIDAPEMPGASELLHSLKQLDFRLHLNSATPEESLLAIVEGRGWMERFDGIHGHPNGKEETLSAVLEIEKLSPGEVAVVGDGVDDERAASALGCAFVPVGAGSYSRSQPGRPTYGLHEVPDQIGIGTNHRSGR